MNLYTGASLSALAKRYILSLYKENSPSFLFSFLGPVVRTPVGANPGLNFKQYQVTALKHTYQLRGLLRGLLRGMPVPYACAQPYQHGIAV